MVEPDTPSVSFRLRLHELRMMAGMKTETETGSKMFQRENKEKMGCVNLDVKIKLGKKLTLELD